jgi:tetratricopeptide (TPR) repeat protein
VDDAMAAFTAGDFAKTVELASKVDAKDPQKPRALYLVGEAELARGDAAAAEKAFSAVLETKEDSVPALSGLGRALTRQGSREEAEKTLRRAVELDAKDVGAARALGEELTAAGKHDEARKTLEAARKLDPKDPLTNRALVEAILRSEKPEGADAAAKAFAKLAPDTAMSWFLRALVLDRRNEAKDAIEAYEKAIAKDDRFLDAHKNLAILCVAQSATYSNQERVEKAFRHFEKYYALGGKDKELEEIYRTIKSVLDEMKRGR